MSVAMEIDGVSICITSYNYASYLPLALSSAVGQKEANLQIEVVVVDNASTDGSWEVIERYAQRFPEVRAYRNDQNIGAIHNHRRAIELATYERILLLSADDYLLPGNVKRLVEAHRAYPEIDYIYGSYIQIDENGNFLRYLGHPGHTRGAYFGARNEFADLLTFDCYICASTTLLRRSVLLNNPADESLVVADYDHYLMLAATGSTFGFIDSPGSVIRVHANEVTGKDRYVATGLQLEEQISLVQKHLQPGSLDKIAGHEQGVANLILSKLHNLRAYPSTFELIMQRAKPRLDEIFAMLNASRTRTLTTPVEAEPLITVVIAAGNDVAAVDQLLRNLQKQRYGRWEIVLALNSKYDISGFLLDRVDDERVRTLRYRGEAESAVALNDALTVARGTIVAYAEAYTRWNESYLQSLAARYAGNVFDALIVSADLELQNKTTVRDFAGSSVAASSIGVGEGVPLGAFSHRRDAIDRFGRFDENILLHETDFINRIYFSGKTALDSDTRVVISETLRHSATMHDLNSYVSSLKILHQRSPQANPELLIRQEAHIRRVNEDPEAANGVDFLKALRWFYHVRLA